MIVDDDLYARIRIKTELRLEQDGFLVDKEAVSGPEALEKIKADPPDIVLTDMKMPGMSGVAFIEELHRIHPEIPVVALSGYDDYEYVRASLKLGAVDYLLKHEMSRETVLEALHKCVERLQLSAESGRFRQEEARELEQAADRRQEILRMLRGDCTGLHVPVFQGKNGTLQLIVMQIDHVRRIEKENGKLELLMMIPVILSLLQQVVDQYASGVVESMGEGQFVILASFEGMYSQQYIWNIRHKMIQSLRKNLEKYTSLTASFAVGRVAHRPQELAECYRQACRELSLSYLTGDNSLLSVSPEPRGGSSDELFTLRPEDEREIAAAVEARDRDACLAAVSGVFESLMRVEANRTSCQVVCMELLNLVVRSTRELPLSEPLQSFCAKRKGDVLENDSVQESRLQILEAYERLFDFLEQNAPHFLLQPQHRERHRLHPQPLSGGHQPRRGGRKAQPEQILSQPHLQPRLREKLHGVRLLLPRGAGKAAARRRAADRRGGRKGGHRQPLLFFPRVQELRGRHAQDVRENVKKVQ